MALLGLVIFLFWPSPPAPVPPPHDDGEKTETAQDNKTAENPSVPASGAPPAKGVSTQGADKHDDTKKTEVTPAPAPPSPAPDQTKQVLLEKPPGPGPSNGQEQPNADIRDAIALNLEEKYKFSPLGRELLATTRGCYAFLRQEYALARSWMRSDIAKANPASMYWYALMVEKGETVPQDYAVALALLTSSANAGFYYAQFHLAEIYLNGLYPLVPTDPAKGKIWLIKAVKESRPEALRLAAEIGLKSSDYDPTFNTLNEALGRSYQDAFKVASALLQDNTTSGIFWTGTLTFYGQGTIRDQKQGRDLILRAARLYSWPALVDVANWSADGFETEKGPVEAAAIAYIARENTSSPDEAQIVDKVIAPLVTALSAEQYQDLGTLLRGVTSLPVRRSD
ncbi:MAG: tetratricopeptide repeat protein [Hyphomicrobium sp.]|uniref:tetratricopeptide repeat protein n=1 Tax=Hyphomicrobium sp. TaxID=82 RepID=UPI0039E49D9F